MSVFHRLVFTFRCALFLRTQPRATISVSCGSGRLTNVVRRGIISGFNRDTICAPAGHWFIRIIPRGARINVIGIATIYVIPAQRIILTVPITVCRCGCLRIATDIHSRINGHRVPTSIRTGVINFPVATFPGQRVDGARVTDRGTGATPRT